MTFREWFTEYHSAFCEGVIAHDKAREYMCIFKKHFQYIAEMELAEIKPIDIQRCIKSAKEYCNTRQRDTFFLLRRVLQEAVFNSLIEKNPAEHIRAPKKQRSFADTFDRQQLSWLFDSDDRLSRMFLFDLWTGLRRGELLALDWSNIDLENKLLTVCQTLVKVKGGETIRNTTKSRCERVVPLSDTACELLKQIREKDTQSGLVFVTERGHSVSLRNYERLYKKFFAQQQDKHPQLKYMSAHKLRHSYATFMLHSGADVDTLRALLGHVDISTTQRYVHSNLEQMRSATSKLCFV